MHTDIEVPLEERTRLVFIHHGVAAHVLGRCIGQTDVELSTEGAETIRRLLTHGFASLGAAFAGRIRLVSSDLARAAASAEILADGLDTPVEHDARLREMHFGEWDGRAWREIERNDAQRLGAWMERWTEHPAPNGEGVADVMQRAADWIADADPVGHIERCFVVVSHAGWIRAALTHLFGFEPARMFDIPIDHGRATIVDVTPSAKRLVASNVDRLE